MTKKRANGGGSVSSRKVGRAVGVLIDASGKTRRITSKTIVRAEMSAAFVAKPPSRTRALRVRFYSFVCTREG